MLKIIGALAAGNAVGQAIQLVGLPLIARLYDPSAFGFFAQVSAISSIVSVIGTLQMASAMVLPKSEHESRDLFAVGLYSSTVVGALTFGVLLGFRTLLLNSSSFHLAAIGAGLVLSVCYGVLYRGWLAARAKFGVLSWLATVRGLLIVGLQGLFGLLRVNHGLLYGALLCEFVVIVVLVARRQAPGVSIALRWRWSTVRSRLHAYRDFCLTGTVQELISVAAFTAPLYLFPRVYGADTGGQYAMASRLIWAPITLITGAITQVVYRRLASLPPNELAHHKALRLGRHAAVVFAATAAAIFLAPPLLRVLLGSTWSAASEMSRWVLLSGAAYALAVPHRVCYRVLRRQHFQLAIDAGTLALLLSCFALLPRNQPTYTLVCIAGLALLQNGVLVMAMSAHVKALATPRAHPI